MSEWNGRYMGVGNGGAAGSIIYDGKMIGANVFGLAQALKDGFAVAGTDTGHKGRGDDYSFGPGHPERRIDYYYRAIHETAVTAKEVIRVFYGSSPKYSYFSGCSYGGKQALMEVQRYPADYDGVLAGSPPVYRKDLLATQIWVAQTLAVSPIAESKLPAIQAAVIAACDTLDGLKDGIIGDPARCRFDRGTLLCAGAEHERCLTQSQVTALKKYYSGPRNSKSEQIAPSFPSGAEGCVWGSMTCEGSAARRTSILLDGLLDSRWDVRTFDFDRDVQALEVDHEVRLGDTTEANLKPFKDRGGKLIIEHGWSDGTTVPEGAVKYYEDVVSNTGEDAAKDFVRLYMVPGMPHCGGPGHGGLPTGPAPNRFGEAMTSALIRWVEDGVPPSPIVATKYNRDGSPGSGVARTRPLCPYPQVARYKGSGSTDDAANFSCDTR